MPIGLWVGSVWCYLSPVWFGLIAALLVPQMASLYRAPAILSVPVVAVLVTASSMFTLAIPVAIIAVAFKDLHAALMAPLQMFASYLLWMALLVPPALALVASALSRRLLCDPTSVLPEDLQVPDEAVSGDPW